MIPSAWTRKTTESSLLVTSKVSLLLVPPSLTVTSCARPGPTGKQSTEETTMTVITDALIMTNLPCLFQSASEMLVADHYAP